MGRTMAQDHSETLHILGADEHDCGPALARQRMAEITEWRQRAKAAEARLTVLEAHEGAMLEEFERLFQAVEGYRCGSLTRDGLMHYYEIARQFRIAHPFPPADKEQP